MVKVLEDDKSPQELSRERELRVTDTINLRATDRVPVSCELGFFAARYAGVPCSAFYYDFDSWLNAYRTTLQDFRPDIAVTRQFSPGRAWERLDPKHVRWAGNQLDENNGFQTIELECLADDEFDMFLENPVDLIIRRFLPRRFGSLQCFSLLPDLSGLDWLEPWMADDLALLLTDPAVESAINNLQEAGREIRKYRSRMAEFDQLLKDFGYARFYQGAALPPFDVFSHIVRGMRRTTLDMYRRPEKVLQACDYLLKKALERPMPPPNEFGNARFFMTNTRGTDDFMSMKQFETFYWPTFKTLVVALIDRGATPCIFLEGNFTSRLEHLLQFPKGKFAVRLDTTDIFKAKEILRDHCCIEGNVPSTLLQFGSAQEVKDYCKRLIDVVGKGGGFILSPRSTTDTAKPENVKTMIEFTKEYGRY
jgi:hypothetical protein